MSFFGGDGGNARARFEGAAEGDGGEDDRTSSLPPLEGKEKNLYHIYKTQRHSASGIFMGCVYLCSTMHLRLLQLFLCLGSRSGVCAENKSTYSVVYDFLLKINEGGAGAGGSVGSSGRPSLPRNMVQPNVGSSHMLAQIIHERGESTAGQDEAGHSADTVKYSRSHARRSNDDADADKDVDFPGAGAGSMGLAFGLGDIVNLAREPLHDDNVPKDKQLRAAVLEGRADLAR